MILSVPGAIYTAAIAASQVPDEEAWPTPRVRKAGRGYAYDYEVTEPQRRLIVSHVADVAEILTGSGDEDASQDRSAMRRWLEKQEAI